MIPLALLSLAVGLMIAFHFKAPATFESRQYHVGVGSAQALVDTPSSQVADLGGADAPSADIATLSARASLLANLMTNSPMKEEIAVRAGIRPGQLIAVPPPSAEPGVVGAATSSPGAEVGLADPRARILKATIPELQSGQIPIILVQTQAPNAAGAARLADQAIAVLRRHLLTVANGDRVPAGRRVIVRGLGRAQASLESRGPGPSTAVIAVLVVFALGCAAILGVVALVGGWRRAMADDHAQADAAPPDVEQDGDDEPFDAPDLALVHREPAGRRS